MTLANFKVRIKDNITQTTTDRANIAIANKYKFAYGLDNGIYALDLGLLLSNGTGTNVVLRGFDQIFQGNIVQMKIYLKWLVKHASYGFYRFCYLTLNGAITKVVLCDVSLLF